MTIKIRQDFMDYQAVHNFMHPDEPLKKWLNEDQYINIYKKDWNSLMEVVEKIEDIRFSNEDPKAYISEHRFRVEMNWTLCVIFDNQEFNCVGYGNEVSRLASVYKAVLEFVHWYNQNK